MDGTAVNDGLAHGIRAGAFGYASADGELSRLRDDDLREALAHANLPTLLLVLCHLTGDRRWLDPPYRPVPGRGPGDNDSAGLSDALQAEIRHEAFRILTELRSGLRRPAPPPSSEQLAEMLALSIGERVPEGSAPLLAEELGLRPRQVPLSPPAGFNAVVVGAGLSGVLAAKAFGEAGVDCTVVEKNARVGGTWYENAYPGCGVDTPTHLYSYSFAQRSTWSRYFAKRDELFAYVHDVARQHGVLDRTLFETETIGARWDDEAQQWHVEVRDRHGRERTLQSNVLVTGVGYFNRPSLPSIPGIESFSGRMLHTARWPEDANLRGRRVAVIGTGASAMQLVPVVAAETARLTIFQRSPQWAIPYPNYMREVPPETQRLMTAVPHYLEWYRLRLVWMFGDRLHRLVQRDPDWPHTDVSINEANDRQRRFLTDYIRSELAERPDLLGKCLPDYPPYGKRPLLDNGWFRTLTRDNVELVTDAIAEIRPDRVVTVTGSEYPADVLVLATGFQVHNMLAPMEIHGRSGRTLRDVWGDDDPRAYLGTTVPDFPNMFILLGPNTFAGHGGSGILTLELQMR